MKKILLTFAALMLLTLGSLALSSDQAPAKEAGTPCDPAACQPSGSCPLPCAKQ